MGDRKLLAFFGHHKAATTWMLRIINEVCKDTGLRHAHFHSARMFNYDLEKTVKEKKLDFFSYTNADVTYARSLLDKVRGFHIIRDPRDVIVSAYFSHLNSHSTKHWPGLEPHRRELKGLSKDEGLSLVIREIDDIELDGEGLNALGFLRTWDYSRPNILELKYEDLVINPYMKVVEIFDFLGMLEESTEALNLSTPFLISELKKRIMRGFPFRSEESTHRLNILRALSILYQNDFKFASGGRKMGSEDVKHHFRKGIPGDWENHFNEDHKRYFKDKYGDLLVMLGYENDNDW